MEDSYTVHRRRKNEAAKRRDRASLEVSEISLKKSDDGTCDQTVALLEKQLDDDEPTLLLVRNNSDNNNNDDELLKNSSTLQLSSKPLLNKEVTLSVSILDGLDVAKNRRKNRRQTSETKNLNDTEDKNCTTIGGQDENKNKNINIIKKPLSTQKQEKSRRNDNHTEQQIDNKKIHKESSSSLVGGKKIIPLDNSDLIKDLQRIQEIEFDKRRFSCIIDNVDDNYSYEEDDEERALVRRNKTLLRKKKCQTPSGKIDDDDENSTKEVVVVVEKSYWNYWLSIIFKKFKKSKIINDEKIETTMMIKSRINIGKRIREEFKYFIIENSYEIDNLRKYRNKCIVELILLFIYCGLGACIFRFTEGAFETFYKCGVKRIKRDFLDSLWNYSHNLREEEWKSMARRKLMEFEEELHTAHEAGLYSYSGQKSWTFINAIIYCFTVISKIGYGHISPSTTTGRAITILYAIFGIPMFLIILADFGKLFTRGIKFLWAFVRRLYYTGSCRRVRRRAQVQEMIKGVQLVYDYATFRRPSQMNPDELEQVRKHQQQQQGLTVPGTPHLTGDPGTPATPTISAFEIDDEFNLPISVAITILLVYIFVGATAYNIWERWGFFESFYFVFISMSTIGFGDYVPKHPIYMMCSIVYLVFGLALTSMCINVVQVMLSDSFKHATQKIGATIGFEIVEENTEGMQQSEMTHVHETITEEDEIIDSTTTTTTTNKQQPDNNNVIPTVEKK